VSNVAAASRPVDTKEQDKVSPSSGLPREILHAARAVAGFLLVCAAVWIAAYLTNRNLPYILPGSDIMYQAKANAIEHDALLDMSKPVRVLVIGNSKVMAGFIPGQFEREVRNSSAFNCGQPNATVFVEQLAQLFRRGQVPTHVLFAIEWKDAPETRRTFFRFTGSDRAIMDELFPFRHLLRNAVVFFLRARRHGGVRNFYREGELDAARMLRNRGYYFISDQSRFPNFQLPPDFRMDGDDPHAVVYRSANVSSQAFQQLHELAVQYGIKILVVPYYMREGELGAPGVNEAMVNALKPYPEFKVAGDEYLLYANRFFSDTAHLNPTGAQIYTSTLAGFVNRELQSERDGHAF
jgi:hypothetical protein